MTLKVTPKGMLVDLDENADIRSVAINKIISRKSDAFSIRSSILLLMTLVGILVAGWSVEYSEMIKAPALILRGRIMKINESNTIKSPFRNTGFHAELKISTADLNKVAAGQKIRLKFKSTSFRQTYVLGRIVTIVHKTGGHLSESSQVLADIDTQYTRTLDSSDFLQNGMPCEATVEICKKNLLSKLRGNLW